MIGSKIRRARQAAGLSLRDVATASGGRVTASGLSLIEHGHRYPTVQTLEGVSRALDVRFSITPRGVHMEQQ
jgi:transcriptional regulator with XRE-family HTH domain